MSKNYKLPFERTGPKHHQRGSALLTVMIFASVVGVFAVSYLKLASFEYRSSVRATLYSSSLNLAESGVELGIDALVRKQTTGSIWKRQFDNFLEDGAYTGDVTLVILDANSRNPTIYAEGVIEGHPSGDVRKQVRVELSSGFQPYANGWSARNGITFSGNNVILDSYNSNYGNYGAALPLTYTDSNGMVQGVPADYGVFGTNKNDDIIVASDWLAADGSTSISQGNADVYGYVAVSPGSTVSIGPNGAVSSYEDGSHDTTRVLSDFYADFPEEPHPSGTYTAIGSINSTRTITGSSDPDNPTFYNVDSISLSGNNGELSISGHAVIVMDGDINVKGNGSIQVGTNSSLTIYSADDIAIGGNGVINPSGVPSDFEIYGTAEVATDNNGNQVAAQEIDIAGNGQLAATVYAPAADLSLNGGGNNGQVLGGAVAFTSAIKGGSSFHFDEALREVVKGDDGYTIESWLEMNGATAASTPIDMSNY